MSEEIWAIRQSYGFKAVRVVKETKQQVAFDDNGKTRRVYKSVRVDISGWTSGGILPWRGDEKAAKVLAEKLTSAEAERNRRKRAADEAFRETADTLLEIDDE